MNTPHDRSRALLMERVCSAWRPRGPDGATLPHPAWFDLDDAGREQAFHEAARQRLIESALDPDGLSATGRAVMERIARS